MADQIPKMNLNESATPWGREMQLRLLAAGREIERLQSGTLNANKAQDGTLALLSRQVAALGAQQVALGDAQATLLAIATVENSEFTTAITGFSGFYNGARPSVDITSPTGRIEVGFGGSLNNGSGYFCYSITGATSGAIVTKESVQENPAQRVAVSGGASFAPSGWKTLIKDVPIGEVLTVTLEMYADSTYAYFFGGSILARVAP